MLETDTEPSNDAGDPSPDHPVRRLLAARLAGRSRPGARADGATLALVIEGGGMRGVLSGGMVTALDELGLRNAFDLVVGTSAGALAGAYFLAGQARVGTTIYYEDLVGREWLSKRRTLRRRPLVGLDYLIDDVMVHRKRLDWDALAAASVPLWAVATRLSDYTPVVLGAGGGREELTEAMRASARIPVLAGRPVVIDGAECVDGSFSEAIPTRTALGLGATHVLALLTRPYGRRRRDPGGLDRRVVAPAMDRMLPGLGDAYLASADRYDDELALLEHWHAQGVALAIRPPAEAPLVRQLEQDPLVLEGGAETGERAVFDALAGMTQRQAPIPQLVPAAAGGR